MVKDKKTIYTDEFQDLCDILYSYHITGGPLHILIDDDNVKDSDLEFCTNEVNESNDPYWLKHIMLTLMHWETWNNSYGLKKNTNGYLKNVKNSI